MVKPFVSVVIPVYNDSENLQKCLKSLDSQSYPKDRYEIVVVDDGSAESCEKDVAGFSRARFVRQNNSGCYAARNKAIACAKGEIIASTDSDCIPAPDWIEKGVESLLSIPNCGLVAGRIGVSFKDRSRPAAVELFESVTAFQQKRYVEVWKFGAGANLFTFKHVFDNVGLFGTPIYSADAEWGKRVFSAGYKELYAENACVTHPARRSFKTVLRKHAGVIRDLHNIYKKDEQSFKSFFVDLKDDWPKLGDFRGVWSDNRLETNIERIKVTFVMLLVKVVRIGERLKLRAA